MQLGISKLRNVYTWEKHARQLISKAKYVCLMSICSAKISNSQLSLLG